MSVLAPFAETSVSLRTDRIPRDDADRQEWTAREILARLGSQPGLILADEVGMGKTFVALAVAASVALARPNEGPVVVMVPPSLKQKWPKDWAVFREHCLIGDAKARVTCCSADSGVGLMRLLDDPLEQRKSIIFLTHGALNRSLTDEWVKLALLRRALLRRSTMEPVRRALPRFAGRLLRSQWVDRRAPGLWERLLDHPPSAWRRLMKAAGLEETALDDPVPAALVEAMDREDFDVEPVLEALKAVPLKESSHVEERLQLARQTLSTVLGELWHDWLRVTRFRSPLLIFDEAHHLKNPTSLSSLFAEEGAKEDSDAISRGPLAGVFGRMLFLTATPFQLGHHELTNILQRFGGIAWDSEAAPAIGRAGFGQAVDALGAALNDAQGASLRLERAWGRLTTSQVKDEAGQQIPVEAWWRHLKAVPPTAGAAVDVCDRYSQCNEQMRKAEVLLKPWVIRHLKPRSLSRAPDGSAPKRREVLVGASIQNDAPIAGDPGLEVDGDSLLPFLLAARAQVALASRPTSTRRAVFAEGLASSYEAYLETRRGNGEPEEGADTPTSPEDDPEIAWYLGHLDNLLPGQNDELRYRHPKILQTVDRALKLWWEGEKTLIFCHYRATGRALRKCLSWRLDDELFKHAAERLRLPDPESARGQLDRLGQFFDTDGRLRDQATQLLAEVVSGYPELGSREQEKIVEIALRFLRTPSFLVRYFPLEHPDAAVGLTQAFQKSDVSGLTIHQRFDEFCRFLAKRCVAEEREEYLDALSKIQTGTFRREAVDTDDSTDDIRYLPNVRLANGEVPNETRRRLMLTFNTPFFPEILIASSVFGEGVDLHLDCRFVIHHDLLWNPSSIEQRTGRVDRIGSKAERARRPIHVYLPFVTATQDEKMFRVVRDRERWFSVVMGEKYKLDEGSTDKLAERVPLPDEAARALAFDLSVAGDVGGSTVPS